MCSINQMCSGGLTNITGRNLLGIMETMKFAYHMENFRDFLNLKDKLSKANFSYTISDNPDEYEFMVSIV